MARSRTVFIYALSDPRDGHVRYVGQTVNPTIRHRQHVRCTSLPTNEAFTAWLHDLASTGIEPQMSILAELTTIDEFVFTNLATLCENKMIAFHRHLNRHMGNPPLLNGVPRKATEQEPAIQPV
jgi:hypothetical protein